MKLNTLSLLSVGLAVFLRQLIQKIVLIQPEMAIEREGGGRRHPGAGAVLDGRQGIGLLRACAQGSPNNRSAGGRA